jgi:Ca-activated chloride channel family protein
MRITLFLGILALSGGAPFAGLSENVAVDQAPKKIAEVSVGYVLVPVVVTDARGRTIAGLRQGDFSVVVEDRPVAIDLFSASDDAPVSFTILLDGSGSMALAGKMDGARAALEALVSQAKPDDDFSLHVFAEGAVRELVPFTSDGARLVRAAAGVKPWGKTAFFDALAKMPDRTLLGKNGSRAIVLLTDGIDNASVLSRKQLTELLQGVDVPVYPIALRTAASGFGPGDPREHDVDVDLLKRIAFETGGRLAVVEEAGMLAAAVREIEKDLRSQYLLGFTPTGAGPVKYRQISLVIAGRIGSYRTRSGYRGTEPPWLETSTKKKGKKT